MHRSAAVSRCTFCGAFFYRSVPRSALPQQDSTCCWTSTTGWQGNWTGLNISDIRLPLYCHKWFVLPSITTVIISRRRGEEGAVWWLTVECPNNNRLHKLFQYVLAHRVFWESPSPCFSDNTNLWVSLSITQHLNRRRNASSQRDGDTGGSACNTTDCTALPCDVLKAWGIYG